MDRIDSLRYIADREIEVIETECADGKIDIEDARHEIAMIERQYDEELEYMMREEEGEYDF